MSLEDNTQELAIGHQATLDTPAATVHALGEVISFDDPDQVENDIPDLKQNNPIMHARARRLRMYTRLGLSARVDNRDVGWLAVPAFGKPTSAANVHTFKLGKQGTNTGTGLATTTYMEGVSDSAHRLINARANTWSLAGDENGQLSVAEELWGIKQANIDSPPTIAIPDLEGADNLLPFTQWTTYLTKGGDDPGICITSWKVDINNNLAARYCYPTAAWAEGNPRWLSPRRFAIDKGIVVNVAISADFDAYDGSLRKDFDDEAEDAWQIIMLADDGTTDPVPQLALTIPRVHWLAAPINRSGGVPSNQATGEALLSAADATSLILALTNALANYNGT